MIKWIVVIILACGLLYFVFPDLIRRIYRRRFRTICRRQQAVFLTFDDGPDPESTPKILELLKQYNALATFFVLGEKVEQYPELVRQMVAMGHEIGEHGYAHVHAWKSGPVRMAVDLYKTKQTTGDVIGSDRVIYFRPPYGKLNLVSLVYAWRLGRKLAFWNVDPRDYEQRSADEIVGHVLNHLGQGSVVLLHDGRRTNTPPSNTVSALEKILEASAGRPFRYEPMSSITKPLTGQV